MTTAIADDSDRTCGRCGLPESACAPTCLRRMMAAAYDDAHLLLEPVGGAVVPVATGGWFWRLWDTRKERRLRPDGWLGLDVSGRPAAPRPAPTLPYNPHWS